MAVTLMAGFVWPQDPDSILSRGFLCSPPTPFKASALIMSKSGVVLPSCSFYSRAGDRQIHAHTLLRCSQSLHLYLNKPYSFFF